ncbi:MAG TPA: N-acetylglucosamine-6-phosphate deacetylase [Pyrinomonadaceae bacterium]
MTDQPSRKSILIKNASVVLPKKVLKQSSVFIKDQKIKDIYEGNGPTATETIDLDGATLFPGFIDVHIHGAVGVDMMNATAADLLKVSEFLATQGVTGWLPSLVPGTVAEYATAIGAVDSVMSGMNHGARVLGVHYEGPFVNLVQCGALHKEHFRTFQQGTELDDLPLPDQPSVKMMTLAPEVEGGVDLITRLTRDGWVVSIGHTRATEDTLNDAFAAGARHMTHFMNAMAPLHHRNPGPVSWGMTRDDVTCDIIADGIHLNPSILKLLLKIKGAGEISLISDAIAAAGRGDGEYQIWGETIVVKDGRTSNASGNIAGSVISMLDAVRMMRSLGASDTDVAQMAATNPARLLKLETECGSIEEGKRADFVALDSEGNVKLTIIGGEVAFQI